METLISLRGEFFAYIINFCRLFWKIEDMYKYNDFTILKSLFYKKV